MSLSKVPVIGTKMSISLCNGCENELFKILMATLAFYQHNSVFEKTASTLQSQHVPRSKELMTPLNGIHIHESKQETSPKK